MNTLQNVFNKIATKTELGEHEVNLSAIDDLKKATNEAMSLSAAFNKTNEILIKEARMAVAQADKFRAEIDKINMLASSLKKQFTDIGLNYLENEDVKKAIALMNKDFGIAQQAGYIKQII